MVIVEKKFVEEFGAKCWYTETPQIGTDFDVDHYWPKGRVKLADGEVLKRNEEQHPGYWWKAFDIDNYRYSCIYANRSREDGGKVDHFPLADESSRAWDEAANCDYEYRIILDPCSLEDVQLMSFEIETCKVASVFTEEENKHAYDRVKLSKKLLNLDEASIVSERMESVKDIKNALQVIRLLSRLEDLDEQEERELEETKQLVISRCNRKSKFSAAIIQFVRPFKGEPYLADIVDQLDLEP
ncbi:hypothetical protein BTN99_20190 [Vibrio campbellii]|nr:hypothetical protein BTN99_20190 [Vibrio campbellii]